MIRISQETYDETLEENQDLFELEDDNAVQETITQLESQYQQSSSSSSPSSTNKSGLKATISVLEYHVCTAHPNSSMGQKGRMNRALFTQWSNLLDTAIHTDGTVDVINDAKVEDIWNALNGIEELIKYGCRKEEEEEKEEGTTTKKRPNISIIQILNLFHNSQTIFTLMSLLGVIDVTTPTHDDNNNPTNTFKMQERILQKVISVFNTLLSSSFSSYYKKQRSSLISLAQEQSNNDTSTTTTTSSGEEMNIQIMNLLQTEQEEKQVRCSIKNTFVAMERLVRLITTYTQWEVSNDTSSSSSSDNAEEDPSDTTTTTSSSTTLVQLISLASTACRNSEKNKVAFVRALKCSKKLEENDNGGGSTGSDSTIAVIVNGLKMAYDQYQNNGQNDSKYIVIMTEFCKLISILCRFDDWGTGGGSNSTAAGSGAGGPPTDSYYGSVSSMHDHVLEFSREGLIPIVHDIAVLSLHEQEGGVLELERANLAAAALSATRVIAINDEIVQSLVAVGSLQTLRLALSMGVSFSSSSSGSNECVEGAGGDDSKEESQENDDTSVPKQWLTAMSIGLARNLSGNDEIKTNLCLGSSTEESLPSILPSIMAGMKLYRSNALIQEHACGALAAMALRKPANAIRIIQEHGPAEILNSMKQFPNSVLVQRQGALAIRNIVSRLVDTHQSATAAAANESVDATTATSSVETFGNVDVRNVFLDLGAEVILREITGKHQGSVDEAYAALRDLGCEVSMIRYDAETNSTTRQTMMFGDVKPQFRPVYE